jgi:hypothetical protein
MDGPPLSATVAPQQSGVSAPGFRGELINAESSGRNVTNQAEGAEGYYQITAPTWQDFAPRAGVDLTQYPSAIHAPYEIQSKVADLIPMGRWGPRTQQILAAKFGQLDPRQPMGAFAQRFGPGPGSPGGPMPTVPNQPVPQAVVPAGPAVPPGPAVPAAPVPAAPVPEAPVPAAPVPAAPVPQGAPSLGDTMAQMAQLWQQRNNLRQRTPLGVQ